MLYKVFWSILILIFSEIDLFFSTPPEPKCLKEFRSAALNLHNYYRKLHGSPELKEAYTLDRLAQIHAEYSAFKRKSEHSDNRFGENLGHKKFYTKIDCDALGKNMTTKWYNEFNNYNFSNPQFSASTGHFTQLIWKSTKNIGLGISFRFDDDDDDDAVIAYFVANYDPPGNYRSKFTENVLPLV